MKNNSPEYFLSAFNPSTVIPQEQGDREFGFSPADYDETDDIEFE